MMALLFEYVGFRLPLPYEQLALLSGSERNPLPLVVNAYRVNFVLGDLERVDWSEVVEIVNAEHSVRLADH